MADNMRVATCGDCIHADVCVRVMQKFRRDNPAYCKAFKGKDKFVEVVRCGKCRHADYIGHTLYCFHWSRNADDDGYCHEGVYGGERSDAP